MKQEEQKTLAYVNAIAIASIWVEGALLDLTCFFNMKRANLYSNEDIKKFFLKEILLEANSAINNYKAVIMNCKGISEKEKRIVPIVTPNFKFIMKEFKKIEFDQEKDDVNIMEKVIQMRRKVVGLDLITQKLINS